MAFHNVPTNVKHATMEATVTRADGTVEHLGVVAEYHASWWTRLRGAVHRLFTTAKITKASGFYPGE
jgi:hypothetical protein